MELKTFVAETLTQIIDGVKEAQQRTKQAGGKVNPEPDGGIPNELMARGFYYAEEGGLAHFVEFDVAVTASEGTGTKGGVGVVVGVFTLGSAGHSQAESSASSRVKFSVPIALPAG